MKPPSRTRVLDLQDTMLGAAALVEFTVDHEHARNVPVGHAVHAEAIVHSDAVAVGGHLLRMNYYPRGFRWTNLDGYVSFLLEVLDKSSVVEIIFKVTLHGNGQPSTTVTKMAGSHLFQKWEHDRGWKHFVSQTDLEKNHVADDGQIRFLCSIVVVKDSPILVPSSDIGKHLGTLLDSPNGTADVTFVIDGEVFHAHRAVLAARSPVFKAELIGSMAEATMPCITLHEINPAIFRAMLRFIYTDALPEDDELGDSPFHMMLHLFVVADRYALDRLKLMCAQKLWDNVSVDTVATLLASAEMYSCLDLKSKCIEFLAVEENLKRAMLTEGFVQLGQQFPSTVAELRQRAGT
ncbi:hypothetical protein ACP4OV_021685 [Aristida adscensionis]